MSTVDYRRFYQNRFARLGPVYYLTQLIFFPAYILGMECRYNIATEKKTSAVVSLKKSPLPPIQIIIPPPLGLIFQQTAGPERVKLILIVLP